MFTNQVATGTEIQASPEAVWEILTDFASYPVWNPATVRVVGTPEPGKRLDVTFRKKGDRTMTLHPTVTVAEPFSELRWVGRLFVPGLFDAEHTFLLEPLEDGRVRFVQSETFEGLLVPFLRRMIEVDTLASFEEVGEALAGRAAELAKEPVG
jgi:hypothetical protein